MTVTALKDILPIINSIQHSKDLNDARRRILHLYRAVDRDDADDVHSKLILLSCEVYVNF